MVKSHPPLDRAAFAELSLVSPLFVGRSEADLALLLEGAWIDIVRDGTALCIQGAPADRFFMVLDGHVELFVEEAGRRSVVDIAVRPAILGEAALFADRTYPTHARAIGNARLLVMQATNFLSAFDQRADLAMGMLASMSMRLRGLVGHISELKLKTTAQRLAGFLLGLTAATEGTALVKFPYDKRLAASNLGMSAESLSRALARLAELGVESRADNWVDISDLAALYDFCAEGLE